MNDKTFLIDLDNCLYNADEQSWLISELERRITVWIENKIKVDTHKAEILKQKLYSEYGGAPSCFVKSGLIDSKNDLANCINFINGLQIKHITPNLKLPLALSKIDQKKYIFTSSPKHYAKQILKHLNIDHHFSRIIDIFDTNMFYKDSPKAYQILSRLINEKLNKCILVEDNESNLKVAEEAGMGHCILVTHGKPYSGKFVHIDSITNLPELQSHLD